MQTNLKRFTTMTLMIILGLILVACGGTTSTIVTTKPTVNEDIVEPEITKPDDIFFSTSDLDITYFDLYKSVKVNDGIHQLLAMVDLDLLSDYIEDVTQTEIDEKIKKLTFGTTDQEIINKFTEEEVSEAELTFTENMYLRGYTEENFDDYLKIVIARENYAIDKMLSSDSADETYYVGPKQIAKYYTDNFDKEIKMIKIKFDSETDANNILFKYNLISKNSKLMLYTGTTPISEVPSFAFDETNTREITETEVLEYYIMMYNDVYGGYRDLIDPESTVSELLLNEDLLNSYQDLKSTSSTLANYIFTNLGNYEDFKSGHNSSSYYSYKPEKYYAGNDTGYYMVLNLNSADKADVLDFDGTKEELITLIGADVYDEMESKVVDVNINLQNFADKRVAEFRAENDFVINDYYLATDYTGVYPDYKYEATEDDDILASYNTKQITPDELLSYALNTNAALYLLSATQTKALVNSHYEDVYCLNTTTCEYDYLRNESVKMLEHISNYNEMKTQFETSMYATYYTFDEYLYLAYGVKNSTEMINDVYIKETLQPLYVFDQIQQNNYEILNELLELMQPYYDNYFSLNANHILIYLDRDENGMPDDYDEFLEGLENQTEYFELLASLELAIDNYLLDEENSFSTLAQEYTNANRDDATWGEFKSYGIYIMTENLSSKGSITYQTTVNVYEQSFVDRLIELYQTYQLEENINKEYLLDENYLTTSYGIHLIRVEKGDAFDLPSAKFTMTYAHNNEPEYTLGSENDSDYISHAQLVLYVKYRFSEITRESSSIDLQESYGFSKPLLPASVLKALEQFASDLNDSLYVAGYMNIALVDELSGGQLINEVANYFNGNNEDLLVTLSSISDIYFRQIFLELDLR